jgi:hypothetical protein
MGHDGWAGHTAVGHGDLACRRSAQQFDSNRRGPRRLTFESVGAYGRHLNRHGARRMDVKSAKFANRLYFCKIILKKM